VHSAIAETPNTATNTAWPLSALLNGPNQTPTQERPLEERRAGPAKRAGTSEVFTGAPNVGATKPSTATSTETDNSGPSLPNRPAT
jgi:hypothetical protein